MGFRYATAPMTELRWSGIPWAVSHDRTCSPVWSVETFDFLRHLVGAKATGSRPAPPSRSQESAAAFVGHGAGVMCQACNCSFVVWAPGCSVVGLSCQLADVEIMVGVCFSEKIVENISSLCEPVVHLDNEYDVLTVQNLARLLYDPRPVFFFPSVNERLDRSTTSRCSSSVKYDPKVLRFYMVRVDSEGHIKKSRGTQNKKKEEKEDTLCTCMRKDKGQEIKKTKGSEMMEEGSNS